MTLPRLYVALLCLVLTAVPGFPADESPRFAAYPDGVYVTRIGDAGIPVILKPGATAPVVEVQLWVHAGSKNEPAPIRGISHYLEHLFYRGTSKRGPLENRLEIIDVGGVTTAGTWYDWTYYRNKVRSADLERAIDTLTDSLMDLTLAPEAVEAERRVVGSEIRLREDDPGIYAWEESMRLLFPDHPYGERIIGDFETTGRITQADFRDYYQRSYHPDNAAWVIVGDYDPEVALDMLEERLGSFSRPAEPRSAPAVPDDPPGYQQVLRTKPVSEPSLSLAFRMPGFRHPDRPAAEAIAHMLVEREDSLLETIRLEGTAGTTSGGYTILEDAGMLTLEATPAPETTIEHLLSEVVGVVRDLQEGFNPNYLAVTKQALIQQITSGRDTTDRQAYELGQAWTQGRFAEYWDHADRIAALTPEDITRAANTYLSGDNAALVVVASGEQYATAGLAEDPANAGEDAPWAQRRLRLAEIVASLPAADSAIDLAAIAPAELTPTVLAQIPPTRRPEPRVVALPLTNGGTLVSRHVHGAQRTTIGIYFSRGSSDDLHPGGIDLTLALLQYGGDELDRDALLARITELGGTLSHYVDRRESGVELSIPTHRAAEAVVLLEVLLTQQGKFAPEDIVTASRTQASERRAAFDDIRRRAGQDLWEAGIGGDFARHPKGNLSLEGPEASVPPPAPSQGELQVLWDALLQETAAIVVSGDVDRTGAEDALDPLRGLIPVPGKPIILWDDREAGDLTVGDHHDVVDRTQAAVYVAGRADGIGSSSRDYAATQVLSRGLGLRNFRELIYGPEALAYSSSASLLDTGDAGAIALFAYVDPARVPEARNMLAAQVEEMLVHGMEEPELSNVKGWWLGSLAVSAEDQATMARRIGSYAALDLGWDYQPKFEAAIQAVTEADVRRIADRVFGNREWLWVVVGPATAPEEVG